MQILLIAATEMEIRPFIAGDPGVDVLITGAGVPSTIYHLQKRIQQVDYDLIIQAGIAGTFTGDLVLGQTVLISQDCFGDLGMEEKENYQTVFDAGLADKDELPFENGWLVNNNKMIKASSLVSARAITVNKVSDSALQKRQLLQKFSAQAESMEGAALHYVCLQEHIPFLQIRTISNAVGERDKSKWKMKEAIDNLDAALSKLISELTN